MQERRSGPSGRGGTFLNANRIAHNQVEDLHGAPVAKDQNRVLLNPVTSHFPQLSIAETLFFLL